MTAIMERPAPVPFMDEFEILAVETCLGLFRDPVRVLEWGSGASTAFFPLRLPPGSTWDAVEHDPGWADTAGGMIQGISDRSVLLHLVPNNCDFPRGTDGDAESFHDYILFPTNLKRRFHVVMVDGRARAECMQVGWHLLEDTGLMILHDAQRTGYNGAVPGGSFCLRMKNPQVLVDGPISVLFMGRSRALIGRLASILRLRLPGHIELDSCRAHSGY